MSQDVRHTQLIKTKYEWEHSDLVLCDGELGYASDAQLIKVGDGVHTWSNLPNLNNVFTYDATNKRLILN